MTDAVKPLPNHIFTAEKASKILGFAIKNCWCCGKPAQVDMSNSCAQCSDEFCWGHHTLIPVMGWNRRTPPAGWKPIETAPHNNEKLLVYGEYGNTFVADNYCGLWNLPIEFQDEKPTHWMPLPAAPENDDEQS